MAWFKGPMKSKRPRVAAVVELFQHVVEEKLARTEGGQSRVVADLVGEVHALGAEAVDEGQQAAVEPQRGGFQLAPAGELLGLADEEAEHARRAEHRGAGLALPAAVFELEGRAEPRLDFGDVEPRAHFVSHVAFARQSLGGPSSFLGGGSSAAASDRCSQFRRSSTRPTRNRSW